MSAALPQSHFQPNSGTDAFGFHAPTGHAAVHELNDVITCNMTIRTNSSRTGNFQVQCHNCHTNIAPKRKILPICSLKSMLSQLQTLWMTPRLAVAVNLAQFVARANHSRLSLHTITQTCPRIRQSIDQSAGYLHKMSKRPIIYNSLWTSGTRVLETLLWWNDTYSSTQFRLDSAAEKFKPDAWLLCGHQGKSGCWIKMLLGHKKHL